MIVCEACRTAGFPRQFKRITHRHLSTQHDIDLGEYTERWPEALLRDPSDKWLQKAKPDIPGDVAGVMEQLSSTQQQYIMARMQTSTKDAAARAVGMAPSSIYNWKDRDLIERIVAHLQLRPILAAQVIIQDSLPDAAQTTVDMLASQDEKVALTAASDLLDRGGISKRPNIKLDLNFELWTTPSLDAEISKALQARQLKEGAIEGEFEEIE